MATFLAIVSNSSRKLCAGLSTTLDSVRPVVSDQWKSISGTSGEHDEDIPLRSRLCCKFGEGLSQPEMLLSGGISLPKTVVIRASESWRGVKVTEFELGQLKRLQKQLAEGHLKRKVT